MKEPNSRMSRHQQRKPSASQQPTPQRPQNHSFLNRHRWAVIIAVVIVVAFGVYAEFSSITADNQADQTAETTQSSQTASAPKTAKSTAQKSSSKATTSANHHKTQHSDSESESSSSRDNTANRTFNSASAALAWGRANASSWLKAGYSNFHVGQNNDGKYTVEYIQ